MSQAAILTQPNAVDSDEDTHLQQQQHRHRLHQYHQYLDRHHYGHHRQDVIIVIIVISSRTKYTLENSYRCNQNARKITGRRYRRRNFDTLSKNNKEYIETINYLVDTYFTDVDCFKMIKMLDILHKTLREALLQKNIKINSYVTSVLENKSLYNHLQNIENKNIPLYNVLFDRDGNGIIIWGTQSTVTTKRKEKYFIFGTIS